MQHCHFRAHTGSYSMGLGIGDDFVWCTQLHQLHWEWVMSQIITSYRPSTVTNAAGALAPCCRSKEVLAQWYGSCRSVARSPVRRASPPQSVSCFENAEDVFNICCTCFSSYDQLAPETWVSFSKLNPCPSNCCYNWTILVHLPVFWVSFLQVVQAKKGCCLDMQTAASTCVAFVTAQETKGFNCDVTHSQCTSC